MTYPCRVGQRDGRIEGAILGRCDENDRRLLTGIDVKAFYVARAAEVSPQNGSEFQRRDSAAPVVPELVYDEVSEESDNEEHRHDTEEGEALASARRASWRSARSATIGRRSVSWDSS